MESTPRAPDAHDRRAGGGILGIATRVAPLAAGPALILLAPLIVLHGFWLSDRLSNQHVDLLSFWLPRWCFLGQSLRSGHVPTWLPHQFGGVPFASDPQSGWLYAPAMLLFTMFSCTRAMGLFVTLNPILAGIGLYLFFRHEGLSRPAATTGGLTMALVMAGSVTVITVPFAGTLAWMALALAGASGYLHAPTWILRLAWFAFTELALSQVAAAHLTDGLLMTAAVVGLYVVARSIVQVRQGRLGLASAIGMGAALAVAFPILAAAVLLPRLDLLPRMSIGYGYEELARLSAQITHTPVRSYLVRRGTSPWWGTSFARGPGGYVGVVAILTLPLAFGPRKWRVPATAFAISGLLGWLLNLDWVVRSGVIRRASLRLGIGELWLRDPYRFRYLLIVAIAGLSGYGVQAWLDLARRRSWGDGLPRSLRFLPAVAVFALAPLAAGSPVAPYALFAAGLAVAVPVMVLALRGAPGAAVAIPALVAVELTVAALVGQAGRHPSAALGSILPAESPFGHAFPQLQPPRISGNDYDTPGPIGQALISDRGRFRRYFSFEPGRAAQQVISARPPGLIGSRAGYEDGQSILFGIDEIQGYSPVQIDRYWRLVRAADGIPLYYTAATFSSVQPEVLRLFAVRWLIVPDAARPLETAAVAREGSYGLYRLGGDERASVVFRWRTVAPGQGVAQVLRPGFDPAREAILEAPPRIDGSEILPSPLGTGRASYDETSAEHVRVRLTIDSPGVLVVRNAFDRNWKAAIDGRSAPVLVADYLMQGVVVPAGEHTVELFYRDPSIAVGLLVSGAGWGGLVIAGALLGPRTRRRRGHVAAG